MAKSRTYYSLKNTTVGMVAQLATYLLTFINRTIFVRFLDVVYLGCNGLFSNILTMLSLAELGIGAAIAFCLYKPLAENDQQKTSAYMNSYKHAYRLIACVVAIAGLCILPFLDKIVASDSGLSYEELRNIYVLFLANMVGSYFFAYKQSLFSAAQMEYKNTINNTVFAFIRNLLQFLVLLVTKSYYGYLITMILCTVASNISISYQCDKCFPYLKNSTEQLNSSERKQLYKYVLAQSSHKVGGIVVSGTDNLLITMLVNNGLKLVGLYSNYLMVTSTINSVMTTVTRSLTGSIGNLNVNDDISKRKQVFDELMMSVAFFYGIVSVCILCLVQDFIALWIGESYLLQYSTVVVVVFNFYITGMRMPCQVFNTTLGLFWNDRYKPWVEASINLLASILLIKTFGLTGVFLGTLVSTVSTSLWVEPYILYKHGFKMQLLGYFRSYCVYVVEMLVTLFVCYEVGKLISATNWGVWLIKAVVIFLISTGIFVLMSFKQPAFLGIKKRFMGLVGQVRKER